jgi:hypothetical protein
MGETSLRQSNQKLEGDMQIEVEKCGVECKII